MSKSLSLNSSVLITPGSTLPICPFSLPARHAVLVAASPHLMSQIINRAAFRSSPVPIAVESKLVSSDRTGSWGRGGEVMALGNIAFSLQ